MDLWRPQTRVIGWLSVNLLHRCKWSVHVVITVSYSLVPRPHPQKGKDLVTLLAFLGCAESAFTRYFPYKNVLAHVLYADSAQPRRATNVTGAFPICGWGLGTRQSQLWRAGRSGRTSSRSLFFSFSSSSLASRSSSASCRASLSVSSITLSPSPSSSSSSSSSSPSATGNW